MRSLKLTIELFYISKIKKNTYAHTQFNTTENPNQWGNGTEKHHHQQPLDGERAEKRQAKYKNNGNEIFEKSKWENKLKKRTLARAMRLPLLIQIQQKIERKTEKIMKIDHLHV